MEKNKELTSNIGAARLEPLAAAASAGETVAVVIRFPTSIAWDQIGLWFGDVHARDNSLQVSGQLSDVDGPYESYLMLQRPPLLLTHYHHRYLLFLLLQHIQHILQILLSFHKIGLIVLPVVLLNGEDLLLLQRDGLNLAVGVRRTIEGDGALVIGRGGVGVEAGSTLAIEADGNLWDHCQKMKESEECLGTRRELRCQG